MTATFAVIAPAVGAVPAAAEPTAIYPGATYETFERAAIPARIHVVTLDLSLTELSAHATEEAQRGQTVSAWATANNIQIAINGDYFDVQDFRPAGLAMGAGALWTGSADTADNGFVSFRKIVGGTDVTLSPPMDVVSDLPAGTRGAVGGRPLLVAGGVAQQGFDCEDLIALPCDRAPRTAVAVSADGHTLWLAVVDGWQAESVGMTAPELAGFLADLGADRALMLDGGASSAMFIANQGGIVSSPSDGAERPVANHIGFQHKDLAPGTLTGTVFKEEFGGDKLVDATVVLDDGRRCVTGPDCDGKNGASGGPSEFSFQVEPRFVCVTGRADGFLSHSECRQIGEGERVFASLVLHAGEDPPDAMPPADAMPPPPDAGSRSPDGGQPLSDGPLPAADASGEMPASGGCGCAIARGDRGHGDHTVAFCAILVAVAVFRRRTPRCTR